MQPRQDIQTVTPEGKPVAPLIHGVIIRPAVTHADERGTVCEILNQGWNVNPAPIDMVYQITINPGKIKGWHLHKLHDDRIFISQGTIKVVLYDTRQDSPTFGMVNEIYRSQEHRSIMVIPAFVFHAHQNVSPNQDSLLISMPTRSYDHANPDVYRLPIENNVIPYRFEKLPGW